MENDIYINGKIQTITIRENKENKTVYYTVNGKQLPSEQAYIYLNEFLNYPSFTLEKYTHPNNENIIIRQYRLTK